MDDDRLIRALRIRDDEPVDPRPAFRADLYDRLLAERPFGRPGPVARAWRPASVANAAILIVLATLILGLAAVVGSRLVQVDAAELLTRAIERYGAMPAIRLEITSTGGEDAVIWSNGDGTWRVEYGEGPMREELGGAAGPMAAVWSPGAGGWRSGPDGRPEPFAPADPPPHLLDSEVVLAGLTTVGQAGSATGPGSLACGRVEDRGTEIVAGRETRVVRCLELDVDFWIDPASFIVLRTRAGAGTPGRTAGGGYDVVGLDLDPSITAGPFDLGPVAAAPTLTTGSAVPAWTATTLAGDRLESAQFAGRPLVIYAWATWCEPCSVDELRAVAALASETGVAVVTVTLADKASAVSERLSAAGVDLPTIVDDGSIADVFGLDAVPVIVSVDADGLVHTIDEGPIKFDAFAADVKDLLRRQ